MIDIPTIDELRQIGLVTWQNLDGEISVSTHSDAWVRCQVNAVSTWGVMARVDQAQKNIFPHKANTEAFLRHAELHGIEREPATGSQREDALKLYGTPESTAPSGLELVHADRSKYVTTTGGEFDEDGELIVSVESTTLGVITNKTSGEALTVVSPPSNMSQNAVLVLNLRDGADEETDNEMLARLLVKFRLVRGGGTTADYELWALEVDGVQEAYCWPARRGAGTVDVTILTDAADRLPSAGLITEVTNYILEKQPCTVRDFTVPELTIITQAVTGAITVAEGYVDATVTASAEAAITAFFKALPPGNQTLRRSKLLCAVLEIEGVEDFDLTVPASNVTSVMNKDTVELITLGAMTLTVAS